ncbi:MAG: OmpA family protein [Sandaracinaceae bacterium]|nr:OmpA family protein [Sandaracinaceae bacterium]
MGDDRVRLLCVAVLACAWPTAAAAQSVSLNRYRAAETPEDDFQLSRPTDLGHLRVGVQLQLDYAFNPLVYETRLGDPSSERFAVIEHELTGTLGLSLGLWDRLVLFAGLPVVLAMQGADPATAAMARTPPADGPGLADMVLGARGRLLGEAGDVGALAVQATLGVPTGSYEAQTYRSEDHVTFTGELIGELRPVPDLRITMDVGLRVREEDAGQSANLAFGHELTYALGVGLSVWHDPMDRRTHFDLSGQLFGDTALAHADRREGTALEALIGARLFHASGLVAGVGGGLGLHRGFGSPDLRLVATVAWMTPPDAEHGPGDRDGDGISDDADSCPDEPEDADGFQDEDGCPDADNDADGILDTADQCRDVAETANDWQDDDGCPDEVPDRDGDGLLDNADRCADAVEDVDGFQDDDGCPDPDNDEDGLLDNVDRCPNEAGPAANRGCPDTDRDGDTVVDRLDNCPDEAGPPENRGCQEQQVVVLSSERIEILDRVYFATNRATILSRSHPLLMNVARVLNGHPEIERVVIEGHTDDRGRREHNLELSQQRAESVLRFLVERGGVAESRLTARGYGPDRPIVPGARSAEDLARNRRVEFNIPNAEGIEQRDSGPDSSTIDSPRRGQ